MPVSQERITQEFINILTTDRPVMGVNLLRRTGLLPFVLPEVMPLITSDQDPTHHPEGTVFTHTMMVLANLPTDASFTLRFAALLHDVGKPATQECHADGHITNRGHDVVGADMAERICRRMRLDNQTVRDVAELVRMHMQMHMVRELRKSKLCALLARPDIDNLIALQHADAIGTLHPDRDSKSVRAFLQDARLRLQEGPQTARPDAPSLVTGDTLIALGLHPGPNFRPILAAAAEAQAEQVFTTADEAAEWVRHYLAAAPV